MLNFKTFAVGATMAIATLGAFAQAASAPQTPRVDKREANQQKRIQQGVGSGQLTAKETYKLEREQAAINKAEAKAKRDALIVRAVHRHGYSQREVADFLDLHYATISRLANRP